MEINRPKEARLRPPSWLWPAGPGTGPGTGAPVVVKGGRSGPGGGRWSGGQTERRPTRWLRGAAGFLRWALPWTWGRTGEDLVLRRCRRPVRACRRGLGPWRSSRAGRARGGPHLCGGSLSVPTVPVPRLLSRRLAQLSVRAESKAAPGPAHVPGRRGPRAALHFSWALRAWRMPAVVRAPPPHPGPTLPGGCLSVPSPVLTVAASSELSGPPLRVRASPRLQWRR